MINTLITYKEIDGKKYKITWTEWDYYGGSRISSSKMELIDEIPNQKTKKHICKKEGTKIEERTKG